MGMMHVDYNEFTDGFPHWEGIWDATLKVTETRHRDVLRAQFEPAETA